MAATKTVQNIKLAHDRRLAEEGLLKLKRGESPSGAEVAALDRVQRHRIDEAALLLADGVPKRIYQRWSGRQDRTLLAQADSLGLPLAGPTVSIKLIIRAFHDLLAANKHRLANRNGSATDPMLVGPESPALERYREQRAKLAELDVEERIEQLIPRENVHQGLTRLASMLRQLGETYQRQFDAEVYELLEGTLEDFEREMASWFAVKHDPV